LIFSHEIYWIIEKKLNHESTKVTWLINKLLGETKLKKKSVVVIAGIMVLSLMLSACGSTKEKPSSTNTSNESATTETPSAGKPTVSVILKAFNHEYWRMMVRGAKDAGEKYGVDVKAVAPADETEVEKQVSMIQDQITNKVNAIVLAPSQPTTVINVLNKAKENKIPVVFIDSDANFPDKVSFVGTENYVAGKQGGDFLVSKLKKGDKVAIIRGQLGSTTHDERAKGAEEQLKAGGLNVIAIQPADSDKVKALSVAENILQSNPDVKGIFATSETMALGALRAVNTSKKEILVVGFDGTTEGLKAIQSDGLTAEVAQDPYMIGYKGVEAAAKAIKGEAVDKRIDSGAKVITKENVEAALADIKKYSE
jgi:ribose transport system substrate-binding protein